MASDGTWYHFLPCRIRKITFRISQEARERLHDEVKRYRGDRPPIGQFVSRLILMCPHELWQKVRESMDMRFD